MTPVTPGMTELMAAVTAGADEEAAAVCRRRRPAAEEPGADTERTPEEVLRARSHGRGGCCGRRHQCGRHPWS